MLRSKHIIEVLLLLLAPVAAFAHPGHADGVPLVHTVSHNLHYLVAMIAGGIVVAQQIGHIRQAVVARKRSRH